ncbi:unnamed protein product, partial [Brachionus calyciflorus]
MFNELVLILIQICACILKSDLTRAWYDSDQMGYNWADKRNHEVIANSGKGINFRDFDSFSRRSSHQMQSEQQQTVPLQIFNENKYSTSSKNSTNPFASTWCADNAIRQMKTPVNPLKVCDIEVNNMSDVHRSVRNHDFKAIKPQHARKWWNMFKLFAEQNEIRSKSFRNCLASFMDDNCLQRFEYRVPKGPTSLFELEKHMINLFGWQPESHTDSVSEFYNRKQFQGEDYRDFYTNLWNSAKYAFSFRGEFDQSSKTLLGIDEFLDVTIEKKETELGESINCLDTEVNVLDQADNDSCKMKDSKLKDFEQFEMIFTQTKKVKSCQSEIAGHARSVKFEQNSEQSDCFKIFYKKTLWKQFKAAQRADFQ